MTIEYQMTVEDYEDFFVYRQQEETEKSRQRQTQAGFRPWIGRQWWIAVGVTIVVVLLLARQISTGSLHFMLGALFGLVMAGVAILLYVRRMTSKAGAQKWVSRMFAGGRNIGVFGRRRLSLTPDALIETADGRERKIEWRAIEKILTTDQQAFIYDTPISALVIPVRDFSSEEEFWEFIRTARRYHGSEPTDSPVSAPPKGFPVLPR